MNIVMTGATGFIGKALVAELLDHGHQVTVILRSDSRKADVLKQYKQLHIVVCSLDEIKQLPQWINEPQDIFYHLAWNGSSGAAREDVRIQETNIAYTLSALETAKELGCKKFIGAGSQAEYGVFQHLAREDEVPAHPFMMYGAAKHAAYQLARLRAAQLDISFVWPRIYSIYGVGENPGTLVSYLMEELQKGNSPEVSAGSNMWNLMEISDCVRALRILAEHQDTEGVYHVASQDTRLLKEYMKEMGEIIAPEIPICFGAKKSDVARTFWLEPSTDKLQQLGFSCNISFEEGICRRINEIKA